MLPMCSGSACWAVASPLLRAERGGLGGGVGIASIPTYKTSGPYDSGVQSRVQGVLINPLTCRSATLSPRGRGAGSAKTLTYKIKTKANRVWSRGLELDGVEVNSETTGCSISTNRQVYQRKVLTGCGLLGILWASREIVVLKTLLF
jgi:hypothetical protein